jgi:hypothetical protein
MLHLTGAFRSSRARPGGAEGPFARLRMIGRHYVMAHAQRAIGSVFPSAVFLATSSADSTSDRQEQTVPFRDTQAASPWVRRARGDAVDVSTMCLTAWDLEATFS